MGTADKVCCVALGIKEQAERLNIPFGRTSFILVGCGFTATIAVDGGRIIDGIGGTNGSIGFLACSAYIIGFYPAEVYFMLKYL